MILEYFAVNLSNRGFSQSCFLKGQHNNKIGTLGFFGVCCPALSLH